MRRTRWAVFTRMNELVESQMRADIGPEPEREWSLRVTDPERNAASRERVAQPPRPQDAVPGEDSARR